ncbi:hypothetical protein ZIOFF_011815 [Zingiber officinale]|uniref:Uncharacterized protein n=1 Tax=Zingiber officinale TaxID=94328 RepID=A0A8J5LL21_ZINOF|nr:hypothetical protein ZIOFF_011815 [Zingiber officinale]
MHPFLHQCGEQHNDKEEEEKLDLVAATVHAGREKKESGGMSRPWLLMAGSEGDLARGNKAASVRRRAVHPWQLHCVKSRWSERERGERWLASDEGEGDDGVLVHKWVRTGTQLNFSLVNVAGNDIVQGNKKLILGAVDYFGYVVGKQNPFRRLILNIEILRMPPEAVDLVSRLLQYSPNLRCTAVMSLAIP